MRNSPSARPAGRRPGNGGTREAILDTARGLFAERGYEATSLREVGRRTQVDPALVRHYFGTKERLFSAAMSLPIIPTLALAGVLAGPRERIGWRVADFFLETWDPPEHRRVIVGMLGAAFSRESAAQLLREVVLRLIAGPLTAAATGDGATQLRAELVGSQLAGVALARYVIRLEPVASAPRADLVELLGPTLQSYLTGGFGHG